MKLPIYMDNHATTPVDPRVFAAMKPYFLEVFGNAASRNHSFGWEAEEAVEKARKQIADLVGANPKEIVFTSGATESNNLAIKGVAEMYAEKGNHIITAATEHKAVLDTSKHLEKNGIRVTYLPVQTNGLIDLDMLKNAITDKTILISIMYANNEIGVIQPMAEIGKIAKAKGPQDVRAQGSRCAVRSPQEPARSNHGSNGRRRARARHAIWHAERHGYRGAG
jgi:cysteine desulfurase